MVRFWEDETGLVAVLVIYKRNEDEEDFAQANSFSEFLLPCEMQLPIQYQYQLPG